MSDLVVLIDNLEKWARTYRSIGSVGKAEMLEDAAELLTDGRKNAGTASLLYVCATVSEEQPEQRNAAAFMREAANHLTG